MKIRLKADFSKLTKAFEAAPEETRAAVRLQVKEAARDIQEYARDHHRFVTRSGNTEKSIGMHVDGNTATVFLGSDVAVYQHEGTRPHVIVPRVKMVLRWTNGSRFIFAKRVRHPGIRADPYLFNAADHELPHIESRFAAAIDEILGGV